MVSMKNIINNLLSIDLFLDKPKQPCALRVQVARHGQMRGGKTTMITTNALYFFFFFICVLYVLIGIYSFPYSISA